MNVYKNWIEYNGQHDCNIFRVLHTSCSMNDRYPAHIKISIYILAIAKKKKEKKSNPRDINKTNSMLRNITLWSRDRIHLPETKLCFFLFLFTRQSWALKIDQAKNFFEQSYFYLKKKQTKKTLECNVYFRILSTLNASQISRAILWRANEIHPWLSKPLLRPSCPSLFTREKRGNFWL